MQATIARRSPVSSTGSAFADGSETRVQRWRSALESLEEALRILDESDAPPQIGAQLDLAIQRLREVIDSASEERS